MNLSNLKYLLRSIALLLSSRVSALFKSKSRKTDEIEKHYQDECNKFTIIFIKMKLGLATQPAFKLTVKPKSNQGAGIHAWLIIMAMCVANSRRGKYIHTPFSELAHADRPMDEFAGAWENYFSLGLDEQLAKDDSDALDFSLIMYHMAQLLGLSNNRQILSEAITTIKHKYFFNKDKRVKNEKLLVCIHVRRGDVTPNHASHMWTSEDDIYNTIKQLLTQLNKSNLEFEINLFSQGSPDQFKKIQGLEINFHLDADPIWTHSMLVKADILVTAKSLFSYTAALLSDNIVIAEKPHDAQWTPALDDWIIKHPDGTFTEQKLDLKLLQRSKK